MRKTVDTTQDRLALTNEENQACAEEVELKVAENACEWMPPNVRYRQMISMLRAHTELFSWQQREIDWNMLLLKSSRFVLQQLMNMCKEMLKTDQPLLMH